MASPPRREPMRNPQRPQPFSARRCSRCWRRAAPPSPPRRARSAAESHVDRISVPGRRGGRDRRDRLRGRHDDHRNGAGVADRRVRPHRRTDQTGRAGGRAGVAADGGRADALRRPGGRRRRRGLHPMGHRGDAARRCRRRRHPRRAEPGRVVRHQPRPGHHRGVHARTTRSSGSWPRTACRCWPPRARTRRTRSGR